MTESRVEVDTLVRLLDHILEEQASEFGWDHWHSLIRNLSTIRDEDWNALPAGAGRTIRELVVHVGRGFLAYGDHAFGSGTRTWGDDHIDGLEPGETRGETITWLRAAHAEFRNGLAELTDKDLDTLRPAPWGVMLEIRRLVEIMIQHPLYHIGEVNHIRALLQGNDDWDHEDIGREEA
jgi:uncharacterized damage-inducible protein DinB